MKISKLRKSLKEITIDNYKKEIISILEMVKKTKNVFDLTDRDIEKLIDKGFTFSEILAWWFNEKWVFEPEETITILTKEYLVEGNQFNTYVNQW